MKWADEKIAALTVHERAVLYANARRLGNPKGMELAAQIEASGLPYSEPGCVLESDPICRKMYDIINSPEGTRAAIAATENGLPALAGVDPLLNAALTVDYGAHNMTTATAGDYVANLMRSLGYKEAGSGATPPGCVVKTAKKWVKKCRAKGGKTNQEPMQQIILEVGADGGSITLLGVESNGAWQFKVTTGEAALVDDVDTDDLPQRPWVTSWEDALTQLDRYQWARLYPLSVHPDFRTRIMNAVKDRADAEKAAEFAVPSRP